MLYLNLYWNFNFLCWLVTCIEKNPKSHESQSEMVNEQHANNKNHLSECNLQPLDNEYSKKK